MTPQDDAQQINWDYGHRNQMEAHIEALEAEVAQLRQDRDIFQQRNATQALTIHMKREAWFAEKTRADELEAARDHLRARLRELAQEMSRCAAGFREANGTWKPLADPALAYDVKRWADLLAVLTEPEQHQEVPKDQEKCDSSRAGKIA